MSSGISRATSLGFALLVIMPVVKPCKVISFEPFHDLTYDGGDTIREHDRVVGTDDCRRACILTAGCRGFNLRWTGAAKGLGYCSLTAMKVKMAMVSKSNNTFYARHPRGMDFSLQLSRYYMTVKQRKSWKDSQSYCKTIEEGAHLMEIYDQSQDELFQDLTNELQECKFTVISTEYMGHLNRTISGYTCQNWTSQSPHQHDMLDKPRAWMLEENYCRNPEGDLGPWCYTTDQNKRWEYCNVPSCADVLEPNPADPNNPSIGFWLGARRSSETTDVIWISESLRVLAMGYTNFESGEPASGTVGVDCLKSFRGQWSMADCVEVKAFVCEF